MSSQLTVYKASAGSGKTFNLSTLISESSFSSFFKSFFIVSVIIVT